MLLQDKVVIVSGIGPGLGMELSSLCAKEGAAGLAVAARTPQKLDEAEQAIRDAGLDTPVLKVPTDIADRSQCDRLVEQTMEQFGRIDVLINSAYAPGEFILIEDADLDEWRHVFNVNLFGTLNLTQAVIPHMKKQGAGSIVMINTMVTRKPLATHGDYAASKAALTSATSHLALELGRYGIRVNGAYMGWMWGPAVEGFMTNAAKEGNTTVEAIRAGVEKNIPLGRIPEDGECAKAAVFLASDYASVITGACLDVNGGEYMSR